MNADDEKKLDALWYADKTTRDKLRKAYALGHRAGMTEAAGICEEKLGGWFKHETAPMCAAAIIARRGA